MLKRMLIRTPTTYYNRPYTTGRDSTASTTTAQTIRYEDAKPFKSIPRAPELPLVGSGYYMVHADYRKMVNLLYIDLTKKYGPMFMLNLFGIENLVITDPEITREMFINESPYPKIPSLSMIVGHQRYVL